LTGQGFTGIGFASGHELEAVTPSGKHVTFTQKGDKWVKGAGHAQRGGHAGGGGRGRQKAPRASQHSHRRGELMATPAGPRGGPRSVIVQSKTVLPDGRVLAELVTEHALDDGALK